MEEAEACISFLMGGTGGGKNWVLLWWAGPCSVIELSAHGWVFASSLVAVWPEVTQPSALGAPWQG